MLSTSCVDVGGDARDDLFTRGSQGVIQKHRRGNGIVGAWFVYIVMKYSLVSGMSACGANLKSGRLRTISETGLTQ